MLDLPGEAARGSWDSAGELALTEGHRLGTAEILFTKIEDSMIESDSVVPPGPPAPPPPPAAAPEKITIDDFRKIDLRVGKVLRCEQVAKSEKLLKLQVEIGTEQRQIVAGIARHYRPEDLVGKLVVVVSNLLPATLMKEESHGMVLAAAGEDGKLVIVMPESPVQSGAQVK
jgi:methionyl-tRNA synthetase